MPSKAEHANLNLIRARELRQQEGGIKTAEVCRKHGISSATLYAWKPKYGGVDVSQVCKLKVLEEENGRRIRAVVDDFMRECLTLVIDTSLSGARVAGELDTIIAS